MPSARALARPGASGRPSTTTVMLASGQSRRRSSKAEPPFPPPTRPMLSRADEFPDTATQSSCPAPTRRSDHCSASRRQAPRRERAEDAAPAQEDKIQDVVPGGACGGVRDVTRRQGARSSSTPWTSTSGPASSAAVRGGGPAGRGPAHRDEGGDRLTRPGATSRRPLSFPPLEDRYRAADVSGSPRNR